MIYELTIYSTIYGSDMLKMKEEVLECLEQQISIGFDNFMELKR